MTTVTQASRQTLAQVEAYWTEARVEQAAPYPMPTRPALRLPQKERWCRWRSRPGAPGAVAGALPGGVALPAPASQDLASSPQPQHTPYHDFIPYTRWSLIGNYAKFPNFTVLKMFFSQDHDGNGSLSNFVCSASSMGPDEAWTAGHCVSNNLSGSRSKRRLLDNVLVCPVYDNGVSPTHGCWGADSVVTLIAYHNGGNGNVDFGGIDTSATGTVVPSTLGGHTGWLGFAWNQSRNQHWVAMGYPQGAPFAGGKMIMAASAYGYDDDWPPDATSWGSRWGATSPAVRAVGRGSSPTA